MLSADVTPEAKRECLEAGADAFLAKPIEAARLLEELQTLCGGKAAGGRRSRSRSASARPARADRQGPAPVVNPDTLADLEELGSSPAFMDKLIGVFVADNVTLMAKMESALAARNVARVPQPPARDEGLGREHGRRAADRTAAGNSGGSRTRR